MDVKLERHRVEIANWKEKIQEVLEILNWTEEFVMDEKDIDSEIIASKKGKQMLPDTSFFHEQSKRESTICMTSRLQSQILNLDTCTIDRPVADSFEDLHSNFSPEERAKLYEYTMQNTKPSSLITSCDKILETPGSSERKNEQKKTKLELMAEERDRKRRRISHKAKKSVYTNKKTPVEILREIIENQMENYLPYN